MNEFKLIEVTKGSPYLDQIENLFGQLYEYMRTTGLQIDLVENGENIWRTSLEKMIGGRFSTLVAAVKNDTAIGFAHGTTRFTPDYTGGLKVGFITFVFVTPNLRIKGVGKKMIDKLEEWFRSKNVNSFELDVLCDNTSGIKFWEYLGYKRELLQMRKKIS